MPSMLHLPATKFAKAVVCYLLTFGHKSSMPYAFVVLIGTPDKGLNTQHGRVCCKVG
jgi:hypothetical protein